MSTIRYRPEIDGLRALAIVPVIAFHLGARWLPGGFVGVDVFFVISGYLISSIILKEHSSNSFTFHHFWMRRIRRIMPALLLMLLASLIAGFFILFGENLASLGWQSISTLMLSANMEMWHLTSGGYWGVHAESLPLLHNWSLSVEEQFYLIYPMLLIACLRRFSKHLLHGLIGLFALSLGLCIVFTYSHPSLAFFFLPTRAWELCGGCILAAWSYKLNQEELHFDGVKVWAPLLQRSLAILGITLIVSSMFMIQEKGFPGYIALLPVSGAMMVIQFSGNKSCLVTSVLSLSPIRYIGKISYSLYLWHWPVIVLTRAARIRWENIPQWLIMVFIPVLAIAAYYTVELPGRRLRNPLRLIIGGIVVIAALSIYLILHKPIYDLTKFEPTVWMGKAYDVCPRPSFEGAVKTRMEGITVAERNPQYTNAYSQGGITKRYGTEKVDILVLGNSHALMWAPIIDEVCKEQKFTVIFYAADGVDAFPDIPAQKKIVTTFSPEDWLTFDSNRLKLVEELRPRLVILASRWKNIILEDKVRRFLDIVCSHGSKVLFIGDPPELAIGDINCPKFVSTTVATTIKAQSLRDDNRASTLLHSLANDQVHVLQTSDLYLTNDGRVTVKIGRYILYIDDNHLSFAGANLARERIASKISNILKK